MATNKKQTSKKVASEASEILKDDRYSKKSKSVAGSALSQTKTYAKEKEIGFCPLIGGNLFKFVF